MGYNYSSLAIQYGPYHIIWSIPRRLWVDVALALVLQPNSHKISLEQAVDPGQRQRRRWIGGEGGVPWQFFGLVSSFGHSEIYVQCLSGHKSLGSLSLLSLVKKSWSEWWDQRNRGRRRRTIFTSYWHPVTVLEYLAHSILSPVFSGLLYSVEPIMFHLFLLSLSVLVIKEHG